MSDKTELLHAALISAEAALADIGDADHEPGDDLAWAERRAAEVLPKVRGALVAWNRRATIQPAAGQPVHQGRIHTANGHWSDITETQADMWKADGFTVRTLYTGPVAPADAVRDARNEALYRLIERLDMVPYASTPHYELARELRALIATKEPAK